MAEYDLYIDESGDFMENSTDPQEQASSNNLHTFASQVAGVLVRTATNPNIINQLAADLRNSAQRAAGLPAGQCLHSKDVPYQYRKVLFGRIATGILANRWQAFRLVNRERVAYGDRETTYVNMVAELVFRACRELSIVHHGEITLNLICAKVVTGSDAMGNPTFIQTENYREKIIEYLGFAAVRNGRARDSGRWRLGTLVLATPPDKIALQIADVVSYASHRNFRPCQDFPEVRELLKEALGSFDFSMTIWETRDRVEQLIAQGNPGGAIMVLGEYLIGRGDDLGGKWRQGFDELAEKSRVSLAAMEEPAQRIHHAQILGWLELFISEKRDFKAGSKICDWLGILFNPDNASGHASKAFIHGLGICKLELYNHTGNLKGAREIIGLIDKLTGEMAGRWEHAPALLRAMTHKAVHLSDCLEYDKAAKLCQAVARYYADLGSVFSDAMPEVFPRQIHSDARGRALGTWLQAEIMRCCESQDSALVGEAREISNNAIDEFAGKDDKDRQYQYRSHLEIVAKDYREAAKWLARSIGPNIQPESLLKGIKDSPEGPQRPFLVLHFLRLASSALLHGGPGEASFALNQITNDYPGPLAPWASVTDPSRDYPTHGILRRLAVIDAFGGNLDRADRSINRMRDFVWTGGTTSPVLACIHLAALIESAWAAGAPGNLNNNTFVEWSRSKLREASDKADRLLGLPETQGDLPKIKEFLGRVKTLLESEKPDKIQLKNMVRLIGF